MALIFMEGFDSLTDSNYGGLDEILRSSGWVAAHMTAGVTNTRTGRGYALRLRPSSPGGQTQAYVRWASPLLDGFVVGFAMYMIDGQGDVFNVQYDNLAGSLTEKFTLYRNDVGGLSILDGSNNLLAATDPNTIFSGEWNYIEMKAVASTGTIILKINGCVVIGESGLAIGSQWNRYGFTADFFGDWASGLSQDITMYDDVYMCDLTGGSFDDFLGDIVIDDIRPNSDAGLNQLNAVGIVGDHYQAVDEPVSDDATTYLMTENTGKVERFGCTDLPDDVIDVLALEVSTRAKRDGTGYRTFRNQVTLNGFTLEGDDKFVSTGFQEWSSFFTGKPGGGLWTVADVNNMQIGFETTPIPT